MSAVVIIPARYGATRLPGKLIHPEVKQVTGKYIIEHVYEGVKKSPLIESVVVATDDKRIFDAVKGFGGNVEMTSSAHQSGTDRIAEVAAHRNEDIVINVQGDEPEIRPEMVEALISTLSNDDEAVMATLANEIKTVDEFMDPNVVKVVLDNHGYALYFSRAPIPCKAMSDEQRAMSDKQISTQSSLLSPLRHIGVYAYRRDFLLRYTKLPPSPLEKTERLEQLRALSNGYRIKVNITPFECAGIDTEEDHKRFIDKFRVKS